MYGDAQKKNTEAEERSDKNWTPPYHASTPHLATLHSPPAVQNIMLTRTSIVTTKWKLPLATSCLVWLIRCICLYVMYTFVKFCNLCILIVMFMYSYCLYALFFTFCFHLWRPPIYATHSYNKTIWAYLKPLLALLESVVPLTFMKLRARRKLTRTFIWAVSKPWVIQTRQWHIKL